MEKFSAYRDPGTGIQPFLTPIPPADPGVLLNLALPLAYLLATIKSLLVLLILLAYVVLVRGLCLVLHPVQPLYLFISHLLTSILARAALFILGLFWIPVEIVSRKRAKGTRPSENWKPKPGDIIVSNWVSWLEILWLAMRFNPIFVVPVAREISVEATANTRSPISHTPGRHTAGGSTGIHATTPRPVSNRTPIVGFRQVSLLTMITATGRVPECQSGLSNATDLEAIRVAANRPLVVFPECTTSNGRGLLRFGNVLNQTLPVKNFQVFVMCVRIDPPTSMAPSMALTIPYNAMNPLPHVWTLASALMPLSMSIRLLTQAESPSSPLFMEHDVLAGTVGEEQLTEACAALITHIGKFKRMAMGWEDKSSFLRFYQGKQH